MLNTDANLQLNFTKVPEPKNVIEDLIEDGFLEVNGGSFT